MFRDHFGIESYLKGILIEQVIQSSFLHKLKTLFPYIIFNIGNIMGNNQQFKEYNWALVSHPVLKNSQIFPHQNIIRTQINVIDQYEIQAWIAGFYKIKSTQSPYLFSPQAYKIKSRAMCGSSCTISLKYENYPYIFMEQIINRCKIDKRFEENELWYLLYVLIQAANACLSIQGKIGDPRPHNILFNQKGELKVIHRYSYPGQLTNFQKTLLDQTQTFLSPEQMRLINTKKTFNNTNHQVSESFSIGLILLSAIFLEDMSYLYDIGQMKFNEDELAFKTSQLSELQYFSQERDMEVSYSVDLLLMISRLLEIEPTERLSSIELQRWLKPFSQQIIEFKQFKFKMPEKSVSMSNNGIKLKLERKISNNGTPGHKQNQVFLNNNIPLLKNRLTRALTISEKAVPLDTPTELSNFQSESKNMGNLKYHYPNHHPSHHHPIQSNKNQYSPALINEQKSSDSFDNLSIFDRNQLFQGYSRNPNTRNSRQKSDNNLKIGDLIETNSIPSQNADQGMNPHKNYARIQDAAISVHSDTPISTVSIQPQQKLTKQEQLNHDGFTKKSNWMQDNELLERLDKQLTKSKKLFPS